MADDKKVIFSMVGVSKTYPPQKQVLKNIYLSFFYGAKIGIIGLNGSGKSTLLKIIAGLDTSYQGEVVFSPGYSVGYLPQEPQLDDEKTVTLCRIRSTAASSNRPLPRRLPMVDRVGTQIQPFSAIACSDASS